MRPGITSIQRNRAPCIKEWLSLEMVMGFDRFHLCAHCCDDDTVGILLRLSRHSPIVAPQLPPDTPLPENVAYQHAWGSVGASVGWMAFIACDEFLFPIQADTVWQALAPFAELPVSAVGVHWMCCGSSGPLQEPAGLVLENLTRLARPGFTAYRRVKSVGCRGEPEVLIDRSHDLQTLRGTVDNCGPPVTHRLMKDHELITPRCASITTSPRTGSIPPRSSSTAARPMSARTPCGATPRSVRTIPTSATTACASVSRWT